MKPSRRNTWPNPWWRHPMETFSELLAICAGNSPVNSPHKGQRRGTLMFSLIYARINGWVNNREVGDLRRHCAHYDVIVMPQVSMLHHTKSKLTAIHAPFDKNNGRFFKHKNQHDMVLRFSLDWVHLLNVYWWLFPVNFYPNRIYGLCVACVRNVARD